MKKVKAIILAGGKGSRMKSELPKVLHKVYDKCIIDYICDACDNSNITDQYVVVGHKGDIVKSSLKNRNKVTCVNQEQQLGTGHAVMQVKDYIDDDDIVLVINGDQPLISSLTIKSLISFCKQGNYGGVVLSAIIDNPGSLGRIVRDSYGNLNRIVERKDCNENEEKINEINIGVYCFNGKLLKDSLSKLDDNNAQNEYYITDIPTHIKNMGSSFGVYAIADITEYQGINSREELSIATSTLLDKTRKLHMNNGVTLIDPDNTYISLDVKIGKDTIVYPGTNIQGKTVIGNNCIIGPNANIIDSVIGDNVVIESSKIVESNISNNCKIGPFANLRFNTNISDNSKVGSFVETKNVNIGKNTKIPHHIYVGDSDIGNNVEVACGVITSNMNTRGVKNRTVIKDNAFIGCNSVLIAPVVIEEGAVVAASSTISNTVPSNALAITRAELKIKENYNKK